MGEKHTTNRPAGSPNAPLTHKLILLVLTGILVILLIQRVPLAPEPRRAGTSAQDAPKWGRSRVEVSQDKSWDPSKNEAASHADSTPTHPGGFTPHPTPTREQAARSDGDQSSQLTELRKPQASLVMLAPLNAIAVGTLETRGLEIFGRVTLLGTPPTLKPLPDNLRCNGDPLSIQRPQPYKVSEDRGLADTLVFIAAGPTIDGYDATPPTNSVVIDIEGCFFSSYVVAAQVNQPVVFRGQDLGKNVLQAKDQNGVHTLLGIHMGRDRELVVRFQTPSLFQAITSLEHPWMLCYISSLPHPWHSLTDSNGYYRLPKLKPGLHQLMVSHRKAGTLKVQVMAIEHDAPSGLHLEMAVPTREESTTASSR
ncbi:MAG: hypothetical protein FJ405_16165 [Verrucomicrobia bacterium]|nr:hypothetical protein [Verrucomicrobiota bacterium]